jgi:hypothetical protein
LDGWFLAPNFELFQRHRGSYVKFFKATFPFLLLPAFSLQFLIPGSRLPRSRSPGFLACDCSASCLSTLRLPSDPASRLTLSLLLSLQIPYPLTILTVAVANTWFSYVSQLLSTVALYHFLSKSFAAWATAGLALISAASLTALRAISGAGAVSWVISEAGVKATVADEKILLDFLQWHSSLTCALVGKLSIQISTIRIAVQPPPHWVLAVTFLILEGCNGEYAYYSARLIVLLY